MAERPLDPDRGRPHRRSLRAYLGLLLLLFLLVIGAAVAYERDRNLHDAERSAEELVAFRASVAADDLDRSLEDVKGAVATFAGNQSLTTLFTAPSVEGCTLTFTGAGAFPEGHLDVVDRTGRVLCSSQVVTAAPLYADTVVLDPVTGGAAVHGPFVDPATNLRSLAVVAPIGDHGVVATIVELDAVPSELARSFGGALDTTFDLVGPDGDVVGPAPVGDAIRRREPIADVGWAVEASVHRSVALADAKARNDSLFVIALAGAAALVLATYALHRRLVKPIARLGASVRAGYDPDTPLRVRSSDPREVIELAEDFDGLRHEVAAELALREAAEERYHQLFRAHPAPMWVYDRETLRFLVVNDAAVEAYGWSQEELLGMTIADIRPPGEMDAVLESIADNPRRERSGPWRHLAKDGRLLEVEITSDAIEFDGRPARVVMAIDVTQRERARTLMQRTQRMETLGQLAGGIAHDFNNILAVILGFGELASGQVRDAAEEDPARWAVAVEATNAILDAAGRASALTDQLLGFARGEDAVRGPLDLNALVERLDGLLRHSLGRGIDLEVRLAEDLAPVLANSAQVEQVLVNLAVNARDAMPEGGCFLVETSAFDVVADDDRRLSTDPDLPAGPYVRLRVSDSGSGMTREQRDNAFEPFFTTKAVGRGTGLGLATVFDIVRRSGGSVHLYSEVGFGTTFTILLPAAPVDAALDGPPAPEPAAVGRSAVDQIGAHVLIVDDQPEVAAAAAGILEAHGYRVTIAPDGPAALRLAREPGTIDVLLTDIVMPELDGTDLADRLRAEGVDLPVVFMSGYAPPMLVTRGRLSTDHVIVDKPFTAAALLAAVRGALAGEPSVPR